MVGADGAEARDEIAADRGASCVIDLDPDRPDLLRVACHTVDRRADVVALDDRAVGIDDADLGSVWIALLAVTAGAEMTLRSAAVGPPMRLLCTLTPYRVAPITVHAADDDVADDDIIVGRAADRQSGESVALSGCRPAHDVAAGDGRTGALDVDAGVVGSADLVADHAVVVADELHGVAPLIDPAQAL